MIISMEVYKGQQPSEEEIAELNALDKRTIDYSDIPATTPEEGRRAVKHYEKKSELAFA